MLTLFGISVYAVSQHFGLRAIPTHLEEPIVRAICVIVRVPIIQEGDENPRSYELPLNVCAVNRETNPHLRLPLRQSEAEPPSPQPRWCYTNILRFIVYGMYCHIQPAVDCRPELE